MKILVAAKVALGVQDSGRVMERSMSQDGSVGRTLNGLGRGPDLYRERMRPHLGKEDVGQYRADGKELEKTSETSEKPLTSQRLLQH
jgi:hypothetical protein